MTTPLMHQWNIATRTCKVCSQVAGKADSSCPGAPALELTPPAGTGVPFAELPQQTQDLIIAKVEAAAQGIDPATVKAPIAVPTDLQPLIPNPAAVEQVVQSAEEVRAAIEADAAEAAEVAQSTAKVDLQFPAIGFIDPATELEKMRRLVDAMPEHERIGYPEKIRAKLLAHEARPDAPDVSVEELALAIFIRRTSDAALSAEDLEAKATGKKPKAEGAPKATRKKKEAPEKKGIDDILGGL